MRKTIFLPAVLTLLCIFLGGCSIETDPAADSDYVFYYLNSEEASLMEEGYAPEEETDTFLLQDLTEKLNDASARSDGVNLLPDEVEILSYSLEEDGILHVVFNDGYSELSLARELLVRAGVVKTYIQVSVVDSVRLFVGDTELTDSKGNALGAMNEKSFLEFSGSDSDTYQYDTVTLYFTNADGTGLITEKRLVKHSQNLQKAQVALAQLAKGPLEEGRYPTIPESAEVLDLTIADDTCYVNFSAAFLDYALDISEELPVYSVVNTLISATGAGRVEILVDGKSDVTFGETMELYNFYEYNEDLILSDSE
ncbi:MAG: GerMN domain-containing protein [Clostridiales bacterium]|nr:GerMN domain-containing protein [Clostridiales bacterium]